MAVPGRSVRRRWWSLLVVVVLGAGAVTYLLWPKPPLEVETVSVIQGEVRELVSSAAAGEVKPARRVTVRAEIAGTVASVAKKRGARAVEAEVMVTFQSAELDARMAQARANLEAAQAALTIARARRDTAIRALARATKLRAGGAISDVELERASNEREALDHAVTQSEAARKQADAAMDLARVTRDRAVNRAPFAGILQDVFAEVGVQLAPGAALFDLIDDSSVYLDVPVDEADISRISIGQRVMLHVDSARGEALGGKVRFIPAAVGRASALGLDTPATAIGKRDRSLYVEVVPDDRTRFRVGASVNAEFLVSAKADVLYLPSHVVIGRGVERDVYIIRRGRAAKLRIQPGLTSWDRTEVLTGLGLGDEVIASLNLKGLDDGARVKKRGGALPDSVEDPPAASAKVQ